MTTYLPIQTRRPDSKKELKKKTYVPLDIAPGWEIHPTDHYVRDRSGHRLPVEYDEDGLEHVNICLANNDKPSRVPLALLVAMQLYPKRTEHVAADDADWSHRTYLLQRLGIPFDPCSLCGKPIARRVRQWGPLTGGSELPYDELLSALFPAATKRPPVTWARDVDAMATHRVTCLERLLPGPPRPPRFVSPATDPAWRGEHDH